MNRRVKLKAFPSFVVQIFIKSTFMRHSPKISFKSPSLCLQNFFEISSDFQFFLWRLKKYFLSIKNLFGIKWLMTHFPPWQIFLVRSKISLSQSAPVLNSITHRNFHFQIRENPEKKFQNRKSRKFEFWSRKEVKEKWVIIMSHRYTTDFYRLTPLGILWFYKENFINTV